jgi:hypothetical protein
MTPVVLTAGETTRIELGGTGRPVIGKFQPAPGFNGKVDWRFAQIYVSLDLPVPPQPEAPPIPPEIAANPAQRAVWMLKWQQTPAGQAWQAWAFAVEGLQQRRDASPNFSATVDKDGTFRIDDMPEGNYSLSMPFDRNAAGGLQNYRFSVPPMEGNRSDQPLDLGVLRLE